jgi:hypothetical protein
MRIAKLLALPGWPLGEIVCWVEAPGMRMMLPSGVAAGRTIAILPPGSSRTSAGAIKAIAANDTSVRRIAVVLVTSGLLLKSAGRASFGEAEPGGVSPN